VTGTLAIAGVIGTPTDEEFPNVAFNVSRPLGPLDALEAILETLP
jgi:hypothetical protein